MNFSPGEFELNLHNKSKFKALSSKIFLIRIFSDYGDKFKNS